MNTFSKAYIPYGGYYSTPFCRWQGSMQNENAIELGAKTARRWLLEEKKIDPTIIDYLYFGITIPQLHLFFAHNWAAGMLVDNQKNLPGLFIHQACTTSTTILNLAALANLAFEPHAPTVQFDQLLGDGESQAQSTVFSGDSAIGLAEDVENRLLLVR